MEPKRLVRVAFGSARQPLVYLFVDGRAEQIEVPLTVNNGLVVLGYAEP